MNNRFKLSDKEHERIYRILQSEMLSKSEKKEAPKIAILGGQPGAGKTNLIKMAARTLFNGQNVIKINGDEYRRLHPGIDTIIKEDEKKIAELTDPDVRTWTKRLFDTAIENRRNIIFEGTMRTKEPLMSTIENLKKNEYQIHVLALCVSSKISRLGILSRYEKQKESIGYGRWTPPTAHDAAYVNMPFTIEAIEKQSLFDRLTLYNRGGDILYVNQGNTLPEAKFALLKERQRPLSLEEKQVFRQVGEHVLQLMEKRGATREEKRSVITLIQSFEKGRGGR